MAYRLIDRPPIVVAKPRDRLRDLLVFVRAIQGPVDRQAADLQHPFEPIRGAAIGEAGDVVEALRVQGVAVPQRNFVRAALGVLPLQAPVVGDIHQLVVEIGLVLLALQQKQPHEPELVGGVLLAAEDRNLQLADQQMSHFVHQGEFGVGHGEAHLVGFARLACAAEQPARRQQQDS